MTEVDRLSSHVEELEDSDESTTSGDTEEEVEPKLRYERLSNDVPAIIKKDAASYVAVHLKFIALGTHFGYIYIMDHEGNNIRNKELLLHSTTVNHISIDESGDHIASCSNDGKVVIHGLYSSDYDYSTSVDRPVRAVSLDPFYAKLGNSRKFILGEDKVVLYEKSFLGRYKSTVLYSGDGPIRNMHWRSHFVAWATDKSVRVFDTNARETIALIQKDHDPKLRTEMYRCNLFWKDDKTLLIGWADTIKICVVQEQLQSATVNRTLLPNHYLEIVSQFTTEFYICGIAPMGNNIVTLSLAKNEKTENLGGSRPQLFVLEPSGEDYTTISNDILSVREYEKYHCNDYILECLPAEGLYFIVTLKDFVVARPRDDDDHIEWLVHHNQHKEALDAVLASKELKRYSLLDVGRLYLDHLLQNRQCEEAAEICPIILGTNKSIWEEEVCKFAQIQQLRYVAPFLPTGNNRLNPAIYEMVLNEFLLNDSKGFLKWVQQWPCDLYNISAIVTALMERLTVDSQNADLLQSLGELYIYQKKHEKALSIYLKIGKTNKAFSLIREHRLFGAIQERLDILMELSPLESTDMLLESTEIISIDSVVAKLKHKPSLLYKYLSRVFLKEPTMGEEYHGLLVKLYAEYDPEQLLAFLRSSNNYPLEQALSVCQERGFTKEVVFLLGRMGNTKQALQQITEQLGDIHQAIEFCKEHDDKELWEDLICYSLDKPEFIRVLLQNIGTHVDPNLLIQKISNDMQIPGLRDSLVKILQDYKLQISLREGCKKILVSDCYGLLEKLNKHQKKGILINEDQVCLSCHHKILVSDVRHGGDIITFHCKHSYHEDCLPTSGIDNCLLCQKHSPRAVNLN